MNIKSILNESAGFEKVLRKEAKGLVAKWAKTGLLSCPAPGLMLPFAKQQEDGTWVGHDGFFYARFEKKQPH